MDVILFFILLFIDFTYVVHVYWYFKEIEKSHPEIYIKIGSPFSGKGRPDFFVTMGFLLGGSHDHLLDKGLIKKRKYVVIHFVVTLIAFMSFLPVILFFIEASSQTPP